MRIKICGLTHLEDADAINAALPDYAGFVFAPSRRRIAHKLALALRHRIDETVKTVGVFVDAPMEEICALYDRGVIDLVQLHGGEDAAYIAELKKRMNAPVIKAVRVQSAQQVERAQSLPCDYLLLDTYSKHAAGGTGEAFDWGLIPKLSKPFFLAGGLNTGNLEQAAGTGAYCLDLSSGVEADGQKDAGKIWEVVETIRRMRT